MVSLLAFDDLFIFNSRSDFDQQAKGDLSWTDYRLKVMKEVGVDLSSHRSKSVKAIDPASVHTVITLCAEEVCPVFLGKARRLHWPIPDPASKDPSIGRGKMLDRFRTARDTIRAKLEDFAKELEGYEAEG